MKILKGKTSPPWSIMIYGVSGIGKSSLASLADEPLFLNLENGLSRIHCDKTKHLKTFDEFSNALSFCAKSPYKTVVIDTVSALEDLLIHQIISEKKKSTGAKNIDSIGDKKYFPYGEGGVVLRAKWAYVMQMIDRLKELGKRVILIAHEALHLITNPDGEDYQRVSPNINKKSVDVVAARLDGIFHMHYERINRVKENSVQKVVYLADTGKRLVLCQERASALAKNRFGLPKTMGVTTGDEIKEFYGKI